MSLVVAVPEVLGAAASDLAGIGSTLNAANAAAAIPTTGMLAAAGDEVSAAIAALFSGHGQAYQAMSTQAAAFHDQEVWDVVCCRCAGDAGESGHGFGESRHEAQRGQRGRGGPRPRGCWPRPEMR